MATGVQLSKLVKDLRAECGHSLAMAQGQATEETLRYLLARQQEELYEGYEWSFLKIHRSIPSRAGERYYNYPADLPFERVTHVWSHTVDGTDWVALTKGIGPPMYAAINSDKGQTAWPPRNWDHAETNQIEIWPMPDRDTGEVIVYGMKPLAPLLKSEDVCTLDDKAIVLFTAVEVLMKTAPKEAEVKSQKAQRVLQRLLAQQGARKRMWTSLTGQRTAQPIVGLDYIPRY
jgi:hypothetical protein